jgi:hypothetical protein
VLPSIKIMVFDDVTPCTAVDTKLCHYDTEDGSVV